MILFASVDPWYVAACAGVPIAWGAAVHFLFDAWQRRGATIEPPAAPLDSEVQEANLP